MDITSKPMTGPNAQAQNSESEYFAEGDSDELGEFDAASPESQPEAFEPLEEG